MDKLTEYEEWLTAQNISQTTIGQRVRFARRWRREWGTLTPPSIAAQRWLAQWSGWTQNTYQSHLGSLYAWLIETGRADDDPFELFRRVARPRPRPHPLSAYEASLAIREADERTRAWLLLARLAGLRAHEIAKFHGRDIDEHEVRVLGKGARYAVIPTHPRLWELAQFYPRNGFWFPSPVEGVEHITANTVGTRTHTLFARLGLGGSIHRMRATYGTELLRAGVNLRVIQTLMRHASLSATEHYLGVGEDERRSAIELLAAA